MNKSRYDVKYLTEIKGFVEVHVSADGRMLWLYDSETSALKAKSIAIARNIRCGKYIYKMLWEQEQKMPAFNIELFYA
jgi:hypothetical protein